MMSPEWYRRYAFHGTRDSCRGTKPAARSSTSRTATFLDDLLTTDPDGLYVETSSMSPRQVLQRRGETGCT